MKAKTTKSNLHSLTTQNNTRIIKLVKQNPRKPKTKGHKSFSLIRNGMTVRQYLKHGGRAQDLRWDVDHGYVKLASVSIHHAHANKH